MKATELLGRLKQMEADQRMILADSFQPLQDRARNNAAALALAHDLIDGSLIENSLIGAGPVVVNEVASTSEADRVADLRRILRRQGVDPERYLPRV